MTKKVYATILGIMVLAMVFSLLKVESMPEGWNDEIRITFDSMNSTQPKIALSGLYKYIVWQDDRDGNYEIYIEKLDENENTVGGWDDKRLTFSGGNSTYPSIAIDSEDNINVVWHDDRDGNYTIYYKKIDPNGIILIDDINISNKDSLYPNIAIDSENNINIVWQCYIDIDNYEIYYEKLDDNGNTLIDDKRLTSYTYNSLFPVIAIDSNDNIHITWQDERDYEIYYEKLDNNGSTLINDLRISDYDEISSEKPSIAVDNNDNIYISWFDGRDFNYEIYIEKLNNNGNTLINDFRISNDDGYISQNPSIAIDNNNFIHITWQDERDLNWEIYFEKLDDNGNTLINDKRLTDEPTYKDSLYPSIAIDNGNNTTIVWQDLRDDNWEIYYKKSFNEQIPTAIIDSISPNPANEGDNIYFYGSGDDYGGAISGYEWRSNKTGIIGNTSSFSLSNLTYGSHNISLKVRDDYGIWSEEVYTLLYINAKPTAFIDNISSNTIFYGEKINFSGHGEDIDGYIIEYEWKSSLDGTLSNLSSFSTENLSVGTHTIYFRVKDNTSAWSNYNTSTVEVKEPTEKPDFKIVSDDISFSNNNPYDGDWIKINATIRNIGNWKGRGNIEFYDGDPRFTGVLISTVNNVSIEEDSSALVSVFWKTTVGKKEIYVRIINVIPSESSTANNMDKKTITVNQFPENTKLKGRIYDEDNNSLNISYANVLVVNLDGRTRNTTTDSNGYYELFVFSGYNIVYFSANNYLTFHTFINLTKDEIRWLNISLYSLPIDSKIYGYIKDENGLPIINAEIQIHHTIYKNTDIVYTNISGYYEINTYSGNFIITVNKKGYNGIIDEIISGNEFSKTLKKESKNEMITNALFLDWDNLSANTEITFYKDKETFKYHIDVWYGDGDGILTIQEFEVWKEIFLLPNIEAEIDENSNDTFYVNGIYYNLNLSIEFRNNTGSITDKNPLTIILYEKYNSSQKIIGESHTIKINMSYEDNENEHILYLTLLSGYVLKNYSASSLVNVKIENSTIIINTEEGIGSEWITLNITKLKKLKLLKELEDIEFDEDSSKKFDLDDYFYKEGAILTYTFKGNISIIVNIDSENIVRFSAIKDWFGEENITFIASDGIETINDTMKVKVKPINDKPIIQLQEYIEVMQGIGVWIPIIIIDVDDKIENITVSISQPNLVSFERTNSTLKFLYPRGSSSGIVTIIVSDGKERTSARINVTFISINTKPEFLISYPNDGAIVSGVVIIRGTASDLDGDKIIIVITISGEGYSNTTTITPIGDNWHFWDTTKVKNGQYTITVKAFDGKDYSEELTIKVKVDNKVGEAPKPWFIPSLEIIYLIFILVIICLISNIYNKKK